jgi:hypothetical protein
MTGRPERTPKGAARLVSARLLAPRAKKASPGLSIVAVPALEARA